MEWTMASDTPVIHRCCKYLSVYTKLSNDQQLKWRENPGTVVFWNVFVITYCIICRGGMWMVQLNASAKNTLHWQF